MIQVADLRLRSRRSDEQMAQIKGKLLKDYDVFHTLLTGPVRVTMPSGGLLCQYLPGALSDLDESMFPVVRTARDVTDNRGAASGSKQRVEPGQLRQYSNRIRSTVAGYLEGRDGTNNYCRLTSFSASHTEFLADIEPLLTRVHDLMGEHEPKRYRVQMDRAERTPPEWVIQGTPWTTLTINNTYPTGVHKDAGDLDAGVSAIAVFSRGIGGAELVFPQWGVAAPMKSGDLIFMDAHQWHANMPIIKENDDSERVSVVFYYRTNMLNCASQEVENQKREVAYARRMRAAREKAIIREQASPVSAKD